MPSTSRFRIPRAPITGLYGAVMRAYATRAFGQVPDGAYVYFHHKPLLKAVMGFERKVTKWDALDPTLKSLAQLGTAASIGCSWCLDFGYFAARNDELDLAKISQVPVWRDSDVFEPVERDVLEYAEAMTATPPTVTDWMVDKLLDQLGPAAVVELTQMIALENMRSRFNSAAGLQSQGFSDVCELPMARPRAAAHAPAAQDAPVQDAPARSGTARSSTAGNGTAERRLTAVRSQA
jgi:alkylhydroperoxidase family enzyme